MAKRVREKLDAAMEGVNQARDLYLVGDKPNLSFVSTGCTLLDCALGGGLVLGRIANIVGDKSTAKTAIATETLINFCITYPDGLAAYRDAEAAFDREYAQSMGLPLDKIDFGTEEIETVEEFSRDYESFLDDCIKQGKPGIYVLDSLDALSDDAELKAEVGVATFGTTKAKSLSIFFRRIKSKTAQANVMLLIVSQVRDNIGALFGEKHKRSGGRALDFYASQIFWLSHIKTLKKAIKKVERPYGVVIKAKVKKNKVGLAFREAEFAFKFGYGIDDLEASLNWLKSVGRPVEAVNVEDMTDEGYRAETLRRATEVKQAWKEIETGFLPTRTKYA